MINKNEEEIIQFWEKGDTNNPIISCCCITFNHKEYIEQALDSMLMQESKYAFEIIVHDDVSTDGTREILQKYVRRFPNIIKPIYQTQNQWSLGNRIMPIVFRAVKGQYAALCEGDDYWTDKRKLQIQIDEMNKYPECNISFHYATKKYEDDLNQDELFCKHTNENKFFTTKDVIHFAGPLMPTAAICLRREFIDYVIKSDDDFFKKDITAFFIQILASLKGNVRYINRNMSVYRRMGKGSWTESISNDYNYFIEWTNKSIHSLGTIDNLTNLKYSKELKNLKKRHYLSLMYKKSIPAEKRKYFVNKYKKEIGIKEKFLLHFVYPYPGIHKMLSFVKKSVLYIKVRSKNV